jgi:hypothetical protein
MTPKERLLKKYRGITLRMLRGAVRGSEPHYIAIAVQRYLRKKTGFGYTGTCVLCKEYYIRDIKGRRCVDCIYYDHIDDEGMLRSTPCMRGLSGKTYNALCCSTTPEQMYDAIQDRIRFIESLT